MNEWANNSLCPMCSLYCTLLLGWLIGKIMNTLWRLGDLSSNPPSAELRSQASFLTFLSFNFLICATMITTTSTAYYEN